MIQSVQELPLVLATNTSDITFLNDELRTRSATCRGWLNHTEGTRNCKKTYYENK